MSDFTVIETQEQLNAIIGDRIQRARENERAKFADYDDIKTKNTEYEAKIAELSGQLGSVADKDAKIAELEAQISAHEINSVKMKIAAEYGIPHEMISRIIGDNEEAIREDAKKLSGFIGKSSSIPRFSSEPVINGKVSSTDKGLLNLSKNLRGE